LSCQPPRRIWGGLPGFGGLPGIWGGLPGRGGAPYHERQRRQLCALHALNNLLQRPWLNPRPNSGSPGCPPTAAHPHRSLLGTGDYDVNVVMAALGSAGAGGALVGQARLSLPHVLGLLLNVPSRVRLGALALPLCRPHWLCVRRLGDTFYNLDSKLPAPAAIGHLVASWWHLGTPWGHLGGTWSCLGTSGGTLVAPEDIGVALGDIGVAPAAIGSDTQLR
uniref:ubiquitinyl hydrolase 1 n=1 Tax=Taeniopygia guttata TaxID=59729 RepID=A0A674GF22_TAEGU